MTEESRAFKQERNETCVISTMRASLPPQGLLPSTQETNLLNTPLMACQKGVKKKKRRRKKGGGRKKKKVSAATCAITPPHANVVTLSHSSPPISGKRGLNIAAPALFQSGRTAWRETRVQSSLISQEQVYRPTQKKVRKLLGRDRFFPELTVSVNRWRAFEFSAQQIIDLIINRSIVQGCV